MGPGFLINRRPVYFYTIIIIVSCFRVFTVDSVGDQDRLFLEELMHKHFKQKMGKIIII